MQLCVCVCVCVSVSRWVTVSNDSNSVSMVLRYQIHTIQASGTGCQDFCLIGHTFEKVARDTIASNTDLIQPAREHRQVDC